MISFYYHTLKLLFYNMDFHLFIDTLANFIATSYKTFYYTNDSLLPITHTNHDSVKCKDFDIDTADFTLNKIFITHYKLAKITPK